jgi:predicted Rossmann fold flavoprotein
MTIGIIGGGAAGMMAAIAAAEAGGKVTLMERGARLGRKLAVTGNGRCNLTNTNMSPSNYHGEAAEFVIPSILAFGVTETLSFFRNLGLVTVCEESGRVYPHSDQAGSVVDVLRFAVEEAGAEIKTSFEVRSVKRTEKGFAVHSADETLVFDKLIVACGGVAGTKAGGTDMGYKILKSLGHSATSLRPSLVQIKTENSFTFFYCLFE